MFNKVIKWKQKFKELTNSIIIFSNNNAKILTDTGWSDFAGIVKFQNKSVHKYQINGTEIICTDDHKFMKNDNTFVKAKNFNCISQLFKSDVYDILNVWKNNRFLVNQNVIAHNCLICDEFAFLSPGIQEGFLASVFPVVSSSKNSQIIIVSTPNGMNNEYYRIWNKAKLNIDKNVGWYPIEINWWDVPGRDEKWREQQLASFNYDQTKFNQEYGNNFLGSVSTLINNKVIQKYKKLFDTKEIREEQIIQLHKDYPSTKVNIYYPPQKNRAYIVGVDPSTGSDNDYQALTIWDITNAFDIKMVASFYENDIPPKIFAYIICKLATIYNHAYVAIENNGVSFATLDYLFREFEYENIIHLGGNPKTSIGIVSTGDRKFEACINFKQILQNPIRKIQINDGRLIDQMQRFERHNRSGKTPTYYASTGHDDFIMCSIWAFYILKTEILENYYNINSFITDKFNQQIPLFITSMQNANSDDLQYINQLDNQFQNSSYQISLSELEANVKSNSQQIQKAFNQYNSLANTDNSNKEDEPAFEFSAFLS